MMWIVLSHPPSPWRGFQPLILAHFPQFPAPGISIDPRAAIAMHQIHWDQTCLGFGALEQMSRREIRGQRTTMNPTWFEHVPLLHVYFKIIHFDTYCTIKWRYWHSQTQVPPSESFQVPLLPKHLPVVRKENNLSLFSEQNRRSKNYPKTLCLFKLLRKKKHPASENYLKLLENPCKLFFAPFKRTPLQNSSKLPIFLGSEKSTKEPADHKALHQNLGEEAPGKIPICSRFVPVWMGETWWNWIPMGFFLPNWIYSEYI